MGIIPFGAANNKTSHCVADAVSVHVNFAEDVVISETSKLFGLGHVSSIKTIGPTQALKTPGEHSDLTQY